MLIRDRFEDCLLWFVAVLDLSDVNYVMHQHVELVKAVHETSSIWKAKAGVLQQRHTDRERFGHGQPAIPSPLPPPLPPSLPLPTRGPLPSSLTGGLQVRQATPRRLIRQMMMRRKTGQQSMCRTNRDLMRLLLFHISKCRWTVVGRKFA